MKKVRIIYGLFGINSDGILYTPSGKRISKLPSKIAFKIQRFLNKHISYTGLSDQFFLFSGARKLI